MQQISLMQLMLLNVQEITLHSNYHKSKYLQLLKHPIKSVYLSNTIKSAIQQIAEYENISKMRTKCNINQFSLAACHGAGGFTFLRVRPANIISCFIARQYLAKAFPRSICQRKLEIGRLLMTFHYIHYIHGWRRELS